MAAESAAVAPGLLEELMDLAWPAPEREELNAWVMRSAGGVTQRANSVWPRGVADDPAAALNAAAIWYRLRRQPLIFQLFDDPRYAELNALLDARRFTRQSETLLMTRSAADLPGGAGAGPGGDVEITGSPSEEWLRLWWSVDGRGGDAELEIARHILTGCPSLFAMVRDDGGAPAAVGRLALPGGTARWGGLYCMATSAEHRRRGFARQVLGALLAAGAGEGMQDFWLMVTAGNVGAQALYADTGFVEQGRYLYRQAPLQRAPSGC